MQSSAIYVLIKCPCVLIDYLSFFYTFLLSIIYLFIKYLCAHPFFVRVTLTFPLLSTGQSLLVHHLDPFIIMIQHDGDPFDAMKQ